MPIIYQFVKSYVPDQWEYLKIYPSHDYTARVLLVIQQRFELKGTDLLDEYIPSLPSCRTFYSAQKEHSNAPPSYQASLHVAELIQLFCAAAIIRMIPSTSV